MTDNKAESKKRENVARLMRLYRENGITELLGRVREASSHAVREIRDMIGQIMQAQDERVRREDEEYERQKAATAEAAPVTDAQPAPEEQHEAAPPEEPQHEEQTVSAEPTTETPPEPPKPVSPEPQPTERHAEPAPQPSPQPSPQPAPETTATQTVSPKPVVASTQGATAAVTGRPSFFSPNQRRRTDLQPVSPKPGPTSLVRKTGVTSTGRTGGRTGTPSRTGVPRLPRTGVATFVPPSEPKRGYDRKDKQRPDDKKSMSKRTLIRKGFVTDAYGEDHMGSKKVKTKKKSGVAQQTTKVTHAVITTENLTVKALSELIGVPAQVIIKELMNIDMMVTINSVVDFESMALVADDLGVELELKLDQTNEEKMIGQYNSETDNEADLEPRPPIVTVMGHVDHGKTSLLDAFRKTSVADGEAGGITQHIGAYTATLGGRKITFIDTPGHEAFTAMRARGAQVTDVAIIVVAADDGIMPQTVEAINHAKAANVPIVIACNKIDKQGANIDRVKQQLTEYDIVPEEWGGDSPFVPCSAKTGEGLDRLLESVLLVADIKDLKANPKASAMGSILEARLDKGKGPVASVIVLNGTLHVGDNVVSGTTFGHIRAMTDEKGRLVKEAGPSTAVSVLGFQDVPDAGTQMYAVKDEKLAKQVAEERAARLRSAQTASNVGKVTLDDVFAHISEGQLKTLNLIIKADVQGSVEALKESLLKLSNDEVKVSVIHAAVGAINKSDVMLAETGNAVIIGFNVRADNETKAEADRAGIDIRIYRIIYECIDDVDAAIKGMLAPKFREQILGHAEVRSIFTISGAGKVAGCYVTDGKILRNAKLRVLRDNVVVAEGNADSLKRFKDDVKEVASNYECGLSIDSFGDFREGDIIEAFTLEQI